MPQEKVYLSVDLGAGSSRIVAGIYNGEEIRLEEVARFPSTNVQVDDSYYWDFLGIYRNILDGLAQAIQRYGESIESLGVDTWGVDYGLLDKDNRLIG
ncbi:MAG: rhamnulokinase, partial [Verrucomicrobiota bacterium]